MVELRWGMPSLDVGPGGQRFVRSEGRQFRSHRCLVPASTFQVMRNGRAFHVTLEDGNWFYLTGVWQPAKGDWPEAFAIVTVPANPEVARYQDRQGAVIRRNRHMAWLDDSLPEEELLQPLAPGSFLIRPANEALQLGLAL